MDNGHISRHVFVRPVTPEDANSFVKWSLNTPNNLFDPDVVKYQRTYTLCAFNEKHNITYMPIQTAYMMEAAAHNPEATELEKSAAFKEIVQAVVTQAFVSGIGEIYFMTGDEETADFATRHVFKEVPYRVFRVKVNRLQDENLLKDSH